MAFHDKLEGIEVVLQFGHAALQVDVYANDLTYDDFTLQNKLIHQILEPDEYDYQDPDRFDPEKIAKLIQTKTMHCRLIAESAESEELKALHIQRLLNIEWMTIKAFPFQQSTS